MGQPEELAEIVALSTMPDKDSIVLPNTVLGNCCESTAENNDVVEQAHFVTENGLPIKFTIRAQEASKIKFNVRGNSGSSPLSISCEYNHSRESMDWDAEEATLYLLSGQGQRLATIKHYRGYANATLHNAFEFRINYTVQGDQKAVHEFSIPQIGYFEWRKCGSGWELVQPAEPGLVLATGALNVGSDKPPRFAMTDIGSRANFGEYWELVAIVSYLRVWDRMRLAFGNPEGDEAAMVACACCLCVIL
ncbi:hypothetical protein CDV36_013468 [Fusarium kuroshium]|uniref:Uncharacterized protein n=1 Tax=Fusarium kuroshium TaxID=2010991 RepID=A0A3M2RNM7_9HYPO|nr:hypothetical protein CDV36_013468 [Fusarium kuroshium]